ncbi:hypothetical protein AY599_00175 [Leptolyngbya valderiana BDU 20041]|nr:hypothetical protein AY599_00175 [Leptolyngbya valderiana BDU 20041]
MFSKNLDDITADDVAALIEGGETERKTREYKRELPGNAPADKDKLRANATSLANTAGGDLIFGIDEVDEAPVLVGIGEMSEDEAVRHILGTLQYNIEPKLPPPLHTLVVMPGGERVLIVRIARSWRGPHFVKNNDNYRMYGRHSKGRFPMDAGEIRQAIMASEELPERIRGWRRERLTAILEADTPAPIKSAPTLVVHLVPYASFEDEYRLTASQVASREMHHAFTPIAASSFSQRINMDGVVRFATTAGAYCQLYRSGRVESVLSDMWTNQHQGIIKEYEYFVLEAVTRQLAGLTRLDVPGPFAFLLTLVNVRGYTTAEIWPGDPVPNAIDRDHLLVPDVLINGLSPSMPSQLKHAFDIVWNACDRPRSTNFDANDNWSGRAIPGLPLAVTPEDPTLAG